MSKPFKILGIDPGTVVTGYGLVEIRNNQPVILTMGTLVPAKFSDHYQRLKHLHERSLHLIEEYRPDVMAIEAPFYGKNVQSMLKLGRGQGVIMGSCATPLSAHSGVCSAAGGLVHHRHGKSLQRAGEVFSAKSVSPHDLDQSLDATEYAVAVAICHFIQKDKPRSKKHTKTERICEKTRAG